MKRRSTFYICLTMSAALAILLLQTPSLHAQSGTTTTKPSEFSFGTPLRNGILFAYTYTEKVRTWVIDGSGVPADSTERVLTYYITQRQQPAAIGGGAVDIEANIDSMRITYRGPDGTIQFNTQNPSDIRSEDLVRHRSVLVPSTLVNSVSSFTLSPYGAVVSMRSPSFESIRAQGESPHIDDFTYKRIDHMIVDEYLESVFLPWRNAVPFGQVVTYDTPMKLPFIGVLDRVVFTDSVTSTLRHSADDETRPVIEFHADLTHPISEWMTYEQVENPVLLTDASGHLDGQLMLDQDGVVLSGWSSATGVSHGSAQGKAVNVRFSHQVFVEMKNMTNSPVN